MLNSFQNKEIKPKTKKILSLNLCNLKIAFNPQIIESNIIHNL